MKKIEAYLENFKLHLMCKTSSTATIKNYVGVVEKFLCWCIGKHGEPKELILQYLAWGLKTKCAKTHNLYRAAIVSFFALCKGVVITPSDVPRMREPKHMPAVIDQQRVAMAISKTTNIKHRLQLCLFYACGLRLSEVANLRRSNIIVEKKFLSLCDTKAGRHRIVPIPDSISGMLFDFISAMYPEEYVFKGQEPNSRITKKSLQNVVMQAFSRIGDRCHPHMLRHSFATHQILAGESPFKLQRWMGHSSTKTTEIYVHLAEDQLSKSADLLAIGN